MLENIKSLKIFIRATSPTELTTTLPSGWSVLLTNFYRRRNFVAPKAAKVNMSRFFTRRICYL